MFSVRCSILLFALLAAGMVGCDTTATQPGTQVVVESYQQAQAPLDTVWLTRTVDARETYNPQAAAVRNAEVEVQRLNEDGEPTNTTVYRETGTGGVYVPDVPSPPTVEVKTTYRLQVETEDGTSITSTTTVPDSISLREVTNTTAEYQNVRQQPAFTFVPPEPQYDRQNVYFFAVTSQRPRRELVPNLTPFYADSYEPEEDSIESFRTNASNLLNEANFTRNGDGTLTVDLPWIGVAFYGTNEVAINVVDNNYYDFLRSESAQETAPPGEFPNVIDRVEGGTGIFGSYAQATATLDIQCSDAVQGIRRCP